MKNLQVINNAELIATPNLLNFQEYSFMIIKLILYYAEFFCQEDFKMIIKLNFMIGLLQL